MIAVLSSRCSAGALIDAPQRGDAGREDWAGHLPSPSSQNDSWITRVPARKPLIVWTMSTIRHQPATPTIKTLPELSKKLPALLDSGVAFNRHDRRGLSRG